MYTGHLLLFGYETDLETLTEIFGIEDTDDICEFIEEANDILSEYNNISIYSLPCCYTTPDKLYIAIAIGELCVQYRGNVNYYLHFDTYFNEYQTQLDQLRIQFEQNVDEFKDEFKKFFDEFDSETFNDDIPILFTIPNDCESCT